MAVNSVSSLTFCACPMMSVTKSIVKRKLLPLYVMDTVATTVTRSCARAVAKCNIATNMSIYLGPAVYHNRYRKSF